jgi:uncharacterized membrane protein
MKRGHWILVFLLLFSLIQYYYYFPKLPDDLASHFDGSGHPNGWMSKPVFFMVYFGMLALFAVVFALLPYLFHRLPVSLISLPNRDYWFKPERRTETISFMSSQMLRYGNATLLLLIFIFELVLRANLKPSKIISSSVMWMLLSAYGIYTLIWVSRFISRFWKTK